MRYLSIIEVLEIHDQIISASGGSRGIRDIKALESRVSQPRLTFHQKGLYPDIVTKASSLCFALVMNHPFIDGNKRVAHAAMEIFLILNGYEIDADVDEQERLMIALAAGKLSQEGFTKWLGEKIAHLAKRLEQDAPNIAPLSRSAFKYPVFNRLQKGLLFEYKRGRDGRYRLETTLARSCGKVQGDAKAGRRGSRRPLGQTRS